MNAAISGWWATLDAPITPTTDGVRYLAASHTRVARPYHLRWLMPWLCRTSTRRWRLTAQGSVLALAPLAWWYTGSPWMMACILLSGVLFNWANPVLVDAQGMALALLAACLWPVCWPAALVVALVAGMTRETAPMWAAVWAWHPALLIGMIPVAVRWLQPAGIEHDLGIREWLDHPFTLSRQAHQGIWQNWRIILAPWAGLVFGVMVLAPWTPDSARLLVALVFAYSQLLMAHDIVRLYTWAWPSLALACTQALPLFVFAAGQPAAGLS